MEGRHSEIIRTLSAPSHKIEVEWNLMGIIEAGFLLIGCEKHICHHHFCQTVLVYTAGPLMHKHIIKDFGKAISAVLKWNRGVEAEKGQVEVTASLVVGSDDRDRL